MARDALGDIEHLVLLALLRLGEHSYGVPILEEIATRTGRVVSRPAVYIALRRLESKGLVTSELGEATPRTIQAMNARKPGSTNTPPRTAGHSTGDVPVAVEN